jgi:dephospho-CoA kinase
MFVLAVTGGLGAGKSEAARFFSDRGAIALDLDVIAKAVVHMPGPVHQRLVAAFGPGILKDDDTIDDASLAKVAFATQDSALLLDAIVHPAVLREVMTGISSLSLLERPPRVVVLDVPLLGEAPAIAEVADHILAISVPVDVRMARAIAKGVDPEDAAARIARQATDEERAAIADTVIENTGTVEELHEALQRLWEQEVDPRGA